MKKIINILNTLSTFKFATGLLISFTILMIIGLLIPQNMPSEFYKIEFGNTGNRILTFLWLNNIYRSPFMIAVIILICLSIIICMVKKSNKSLRNFSTILNHLSIILLFIGALIGFLWGEKGEITLYLDEENDTFISKDNMTHYDLPFSLKLDKFILEKSDEPISSLFFKTNDPKSDWQKYNIQKGERINNILDTDHSIQIEDILYNKSVLYDIVNREDFKKIEELLSYEEVGSKGVQFKIKDTSEKEFPTYLTNKEKEYFTFLDDKNFLRFVICDSKEEYNKVLELKDSFFENFHSNIKDSLNIISIVYPPKSLKPTLVVSYWTGEKEIHEIELNKNYEIKDFFALSISEFIDNPILIEQIHDDSENTVLKLKIDDTYSIYLNNDQSINLEGIILGFSLSYPISQYTSKVIINDKNIVLNKDIKVNSPLKYKGYTFYQSSYDSESQTPQYSVLSVKKDYGTYLIYISLILMMIALSIKFYILPFLKKKV